MALVGLEAFEGGSAAVEVFFASASDDVGEASSGEVEAACGLRRHEVGDEIEGFALVFAVASQSVVGGNDIADVNRFIKQFTEMQKLMKKGGLPGMGGGRRGGLMGGFPGRRGRFPF